MVCDCGTLWTFLLPFYNKNCATSKDLSVHPFSMARALIYQSLDSLEAAEGTCDAQADFNLRLSHKAYSRFCRALLIYQYSLTRYL